MDPADLALDAGGAADEHLAHRGQRHPAGVAFEQRDAQFVFEFADAASDRGLRHAKDAGGAPQAAALSYCDDVSELVEGHYATAPFRPMRSDHGIDL